MTLDDLLDAFASNEPVPGGGSAAALAGAVGTSLLIMVGVALDTMRQMESQMMMRSYEGFLK